MQLQNRGTGTGTFVKAKLDDTRNGNPRLGFCFKLDGSSEFRWVNVILSSEKGFEVLQSVMRGIYPRIEPPMFSDAATAFAWCDAMAATTKGVRYKLDWGTTPEGYQRCFSYIIEPSEGSAPWRA